MVEEFMGDWKWMKICRQADNWGGCLAEWKGYEMGVTNRWDAGYVTCKGVNWLNKDEIFHMPLVLKWMEVGGKKENNNKGLLLNVGWWVIKSGREKKRELTNECLY